MMATVLKHYSNRTIGKPMGEIVVEVTLENTIDRGLQKAGYLAEEKVRHLTTEAVVDTGAVMLVLPEEMVNSLGLDKLRTVSVRYADERTENRPIAGTITLTIGDRSMNTECVMGPPNSEPLIGQVVLEVLDLLADCANQQLVPRPESPDRPLLKLK